MNFPPAVIVSLRIEDTHGQGIGAINFGKAQAEA